MTVNDSHSISHPEHFNMKITRAEQVWASTTCWMRHTEAAILTMERRTDRAFAAITAIQVKVENKESKAAQKPESWKQRREPEYTTASPSTQHVNP